MKGRQDISTKCPAGIVLDILRTSCYACSHGGTSRVSWPVTAVIRGATGRPGPNGSATVENEDVSPRFLFPALGFQDAVKLSEIGAVCYRILSFSCFEIGA